MAMFAQKSPCGTRLRPQVRKSAQKSSIRDIWWAGTARSRPRGSRGWPLRGRGPPRPRAT